MTRSHSWIGRETHLKERDFSGLVGGIHVPICAAINRSKGRRGDPPYLFMDLHGGPGWLCDDAGRRFEGSPLIAANALAASGLGHETWHFEKDRNVSADLTAALDPSVYTQSTVCHLRFEDGVRRWLAQNRSHAYRYGLVYSDPIGDPLPVETFNLIAHHSPRVDLLAYVAATNQYKRFDRGRRLADDIAGVRKRKVLIREPAGGEQYTFIVFTDWTDMPEWKRRGFYEVTDSGPGRSILDRLNLTRAELHERGNQPLWTDDGA